MNSNPTNKWASRLLIILIITGGFFSGAIAQETSMRIITYNIWNGYDWGNDADRRARVNTWISNQSPDIVALQELCKYTSEKLAEDASSWGHEYSVLLKTTGYSVGLTSNHPIELKEKIIDGMHHGALHCKTNDIDVFVIHFSPHSYLRRREEASIILDKLKEVRQKNDDFIVLGDFNAQSPTDADLYDPDGPFLIRKRQSENDNPQIRNLFNGELEYAVMSSLLAFPLIDVCLSFTKGMAQRGSFPGLVLADENDESPESLMSRMTRIDYIMVSPSLALRCRDAKVCNNEDNYYLSDHYPVIADFDK